MASPVTLPTFELTDGQVAIVKKGNSVIGQAARINPQQQSPTSKHARLGSTLKKTLYQPVDTTVSFEMYTEHTLTQLALILGGDTKPLSGGWDGDEQLTLNPTIEPYDMAIEVYDVAAAGAVLQYTYWLIDFKPNSLNISFQADGVSMCTCNGECVEGYITPASGLGA